MTEATWLAPMLLNGVLSETALDRESLPQSRLNITNRVRTNLMPWPGQFSPQLVETLLAAYAPSNGIILDPFVGSGTALVEAGRIGLAAYGGELNPAAVIMSRVYELINVAAEHRNVIIKELDERLAEIIGVSFRPWFQLNPTRVVTREELEVALVGLWRESVPGPMRILTAALVVLCDFHQEHLDADRSHRVWLRLARIVRDLPTSDQPVTVHHADARDLSLDSDSVDLVLTSPPYINVFNYHQKFRRSVEALQWDVLAVARSEIGSNRQNRGNRFLTVIQYCLDMASAIREAARVTKPGGRLIFILGRESTVRGTPFFNGELIAELAVQSVGLTFNMRQERVFRNRYGTNIYEDILHFSGTSEIPGPTHCLSAARSIARQALTAAEDHAPEKERIGLIQAINRLDHVSPSPILAVPTPMNGTA